MTQEFHLSITSLGEDRYLVRTETVAAGVPLAETQVSWTVDDWVALAETAPHDPLASLLNGETQLGSATEGTALTEVAPSPLITLGQSLYNALFCDRIRDSWLAAQGVAQNRRQILRLRLGFKDSRLQRLPWELLHGDDRPLATGTDIVFSRYYSGSTLSDLPAMSPLPTGDEPIQVLIVISAPEDQERLALRQEVQHLQHELYTTAKGDIASDPLILSAPSAADPHRTIHLRILEQPGRTELVQALEQGQYQVLHYAGHSDVSETGGDLYLVSRQTGLTERLSGEALAGLLVNNGIRLTIFNSCRGARTHADDHEVGWREQNLVQALVNRGVPAVMAMTERIPDTVALTFTRLLYRNLKRGYPIDLCLSRTRQGLMSAYGADQPVWMLPILYMHPEFDGYVYGREHVEIHPLDPWLINEDFDEAALPPDTDLDFPDDLTPSLTTDTDPMGWLETLEPSPEPSYDEDALEVHSLIAQLSQAPTEPDTAIDAAGDDENLMPQWGTVRPPLADTLPENPSRPTAQTAQGLQLKTAATTGSPQPSIPESHLSEATLPAHPFSHPLLKSRLLWGSLGILGLALGTALGITALHQSRLAVLQPPTVDSPAGNVSVPDRGILVANSLEALTLNETETARSLIEQLLNQGQLEAASSVLANATTEQIQTNPDIAFVRGRLIWQLLTQGNEDFSANDAQRSWQWALEANPDFLEALVAVGFAHYSLGEYNQAIRAWEKAALIDQQQLQDRNPDAQSLANDFTVYAYAGLAMAYYNLSRLEASPNQQQRYRSLADKYYRFIAQTNPEILSTNRLALSWLWQPNAITDWQTTIEALSISKFSSSSP